MIVLDANKCFFCSIEAEVLVKETTTGATLNGCDRHVQSQILYGVGKGLSACETGKAWVEILLKAHKAEEEHDNLCVGCAAFEHLRSIAIGQFDVVPTLPSAPAEGIMKRANDSLIVLGQCHDCVGDRNALIEALSWRVHGRLQ